MGGFVCFPMSVNMLPKTLITILHLLDISLYSCSFLLYRLGLNPSFESEPSPWTNEELLFSAEPTRNLVAEAELVKSRLPKVEYMSFVRRIRKDPHCGLADECVVCLQFLEARDQVRVLGNCCHAFHSGCIDRWVDVGRFSCPLCRAGLLPSAGGGLVAFAKAMVSGLLRCNRS